MSLFTFNTLAGTPDVTLVYLVTPGVLGRRDLTLTGVTSGPQQEAVIIRVREVTGGHVIMAD